MTSFARDSRGAGDMRLPSSRLAETVASLQAVVTLIERLAGWVTVVWRKKGRGLGLLYVLESDLIVDL